MYIEITRGKRRGTNDAAVWFGGKPNLIDRLALWWMSPADNYALRRQNGSSRFFFMVLALMCALAVPLTGNAVFYLIEMVFIFMQLNVGFIDDTDARRSLPTKAADRWLDGRNMMSVSRSRALLALGDDGGRHSGELSAACSTLKGHPELQTEIDAYLADDQTREWENVLSTMPAGAKLEDVQLANEVQKLLSARAKAVLIRDWPASNQIPTLPMESEEELGDWRQRAAQAAGDSNWHPLLHGEE